MAVMTMKKVVQLRMKKLPKEQVSNVDYFEANTDAFWFLVAMKEEESSSNTYPPLMCFNVF